MENTWNFEEEYTWGIEGIKIFKIPGSEETLHLETLGEDEKVFVFAKTKVYEIITNVLGELEAIRLNP